MRGKRIVVGMSGGVDSSVAAALLVEQGYEVVGVTMHLAGASSRCCSLDDAEDARRVADALGMHFYVANYPDAFRREVVEPFADAYLAGENGLADPRWSVVNLCRSWRTLSKGYYVSLLADARGQEVIPTVDAIELVAGIEA